MEQQVEQAYYTPEQLAERIQFPKKAVLNRTRKGEIPGAQKIFGQWRYRVVEIEKALLNGKL